MIGMGRCGDAAYRSLACFPVANLDCLVILRCMLHPGSVESAGWLCHKLTLSWCTKQQFAEFYMIVLDHQPHVWFLLEYDGALFFDAHCSLSFFDYSVTIALNDAEVAAYRKEGRTYLDALSNKINDSAPAAGGSKSPYKERDLNKVLGGLVATAAIEWRAQLAPAPD